MNFSQELKDYVNKKWPERLAKLGKRREETERELSACTEEEAFLFRYLCATLPLSDMGDYPAAYFAREARHGLFLRKHAPWCAALPEHLFFPYVLCPRVNTEELQPCRKLFYGELWERVREKKLPQAILEVNRWCAEHASYRSTDLRTAAPLTVYQCGYGRCGEESAFLVTALRSVGIAARQIYAPWWSHCDDNHAWAEAWDGAAWRFLGACEPEPRLDMGWFIHASSRAMLEHARAFVPGSREEVAFLFPGSSPEDLLVREGMVCENVTSRYAKTRLLQVRVQDKGKRPVPGANVRFEVLNMADFRLLAQMSTGREGQASLRVGLGSLRVSAFWGAGEAQKLIAPSQTGEVVLTLREREDRAEGWAPFDFSPPEDSPLHSTMLTPAQKRERAQVLAGSAALRGSRARQKAQLPEGEREKRVFSLLTEKDRAVPVPEGVIEESLPAYRWEACFPKEVWEQGLLSPRIGLEPLRPWREKAAQVFSPEEQAAFREHPFKLWDWITAHIREEMETYSSLPASPAGMLALRAAPAGQRETLFAALCRACGVPARLSPLDGAAEYGTAKGFSPLAAQNGEAEIWIQAPEGKAALYGQNWGLSKRSERGFTPLCLTDIPAGEKGCFSLPPGEYRALTTCRTPGGLQLAEHCSFVLEPGGKKEITLPFREIKLSNLFARYPLPGISLRPAGRGGEGTGQVPLREAIGEMAGAAIWMEPGREPTEHILNELREAAQSVRASGLQIAFIAGKEGDWEDATLSETLLSLPEGRRWYGDFETDAPMLARSVYTDPERLPLILLTERGEIRYACSGYNVGTVELLLRMASGLKEADGRQENFTTGKGEPV